MSSLGEARKMLDIARHAKNTWYSISGYVKHCLGVLRSNNPWCCTSGYLCPFSGIFKAQIFLILTPSNFKHFFHPFVIGTVSYGDSIDFSIHQDEIYMTCFSLAECVLICAIISTYSLSTSKCLDWVFCRCSYIWDTVPCLLCTEICYVACLFLEAVLSRTIWETVLFKIFSILSQSSV